MWLIIGYGNRLRGDDGAGPRLAEILAGQLNHAQARVLIVHQLTPELVLEMEKEDIDRILFIDVRRRQDKSLEIVPLSVEAETTASFGHQTQPELLLYSANKLYSRLLPGWLLTLPGDNFSFTEQLSPATTAALESACQRCLDFLSSSINHKHFS